MRRSIFLAAAFCLLCGARGLAATLTYYSIGCNEYIIEAESSDPNRAPEWRLLYKCCGQTCFSATSWTSIDGPLNVCGTTIQPPSGGTSDHIQYDAQGNALVPVPYGHGGVISYETGKTCHPFTATESNIIVIPSQLLE